MQLLKGIFHVHSLYSYDASVSLADWKVLFKSEGLAFAVLTEHSKDFTDDSYRRYLQECLYLSDDEFSFIPAVEYNCNEGIELISVGTDSLIKSSSASDIIDITGKNGGITILPHPVKFRHIPFNILRNLDGVELWNSHYNEKYAFRIKNYIVFRKLRDINNHILPFAGIDAHSESDYVNLHLFVNAIALNTKEIIKGLKSGDYYIKKGSLIINSRADINKFDLFIYGLIIGPVYRIIKFFLKKMWKLLEVSGVKFPDNFRRKVKKIF